MTIQRSGLTRRVVERDKSAWFAGPKAENAEWFSEMLSQVVWDYYFWRRNYFPEDAALIGSAERRSQDQFRDGFADALNELKAKLKGDCPFYSPRYAGHMVAEQTLPSVAGYFAAMLYNPNNVSSEAAPVTAKLELEAAGMISQMVGHGQTGWSHLCSGGTMANFEALWVARTVAVLPLIVAEVRQKLGLPAVSLGPESGPMERLTAFADLFECGKGYTEVLGAVTGSSAYVAGRGIAKLAVSHGFDPVVLVPETHHYSFDKALDLLGMGQDCLVRVKADRDFRMCMTDLESVLDQMDESGKTVVAVVAVMGTTEEGAIDPADKILALRSRREKEGRQSFWIHADAAYGGYLRSMILPERMGLGEPSTESVVGDTRRQVALDLPVGMACDALQSMGECDSVTIDPHKLGYIPYPAGAVSFLSPLVKPLVVQHAPYLGDSVSESFSSLVGSPHVGLFSLEGSKPGAAAASVWLSHKVIPLDTSAHGALVQETVRNASELHTLLESWPATSVRAVPLCQPGSNIVCYALRPTGSASLAEINRLNTMLHGEFSISSSDGRSVYNQSFFVSKTELRPSQYRQETVEDFLERLGVSLDEYAEEGVFLLRSVLMNPWYGLAKEKGQFYLSDLVRSLFTRAEELLPTL